MHFSTSNFKPVFVCWLSRKWCRFAKVYFLTFCVPEQESRSLHRRYWGRPLPPAKRLARFSACDVVSTMINSKSLFPSTKLLTISAKNCACHRPRWVTLPILSNFVFFWWRIKNTKVYTNLKKNTRNSKAF